MFGKSAFFPLHWVFETIQIKMIERKVNGIIHFHQCIGRAFYLVGITKATQNASYQCGFAGTKLAM